MTLSAFIERSKTDREAWKYTSLAEVEKVFGASSSPCHSPRPFHENWNDADEKAILRLVFLNGVWQPEESYLNSLPKDILQKDANGDYLLTLAEQTCLALSPLELVFLTATEATPTEATVNLRISLGANARLTLIERHDVLTGQSGTLAARVMKTRIDLAEQSKLIHGKIVNSAALVHLAQTTVAVATGAYYDCFALLKGGKPARNETEVTLAGTLAQCRLHGAMLLRNDEHADITTRVTHAAPHGTSRQHVRAVLKDKARGVFQGKIIANEGAQKTDGYQLSRALLLSDQAEMDAKPELEIYADDIKCSHGSTVGDLDEDMMFYLRSRGLDEAAARALLVEAFIDELANAIQSFELHQAVLKEIKEWLYG